MQIEKYLVFREGEVWAAVHDELVHEGVRPGMHTTTMGAGQHATLHEDRSAARFGRECQRWHSQACVRVLLHLSATLGPLAIVESFMATL